MRDKVFSKKEFIASVTENVKTMYRKTLKEATQQEIYQAVSLAVKDVVMDEWMATQQVIEKDDPKILYYMSMEFLMGRALGNNLINLGAYGEVKEALEEIGLDLSVIEDQEPDPALGNGGLGRLAACFMDSLATLGYAAYGCGIRYRYGMFKQQIIDGFQVEVPDNWLKDGYPFELRRPEYCYEIKFGGHVEETAGEDGNLHFEQVGYQSVLAIPYDMPIVGYGNNVVNTLRIWDAEPVVHFNLDEFDKYAAGKMPLLKNLMQMSSLHICKAYQKNYRDLPRVASFIGTSNRYDLLNDPTGSRRYLCVEVIKPIDCEGIEHAQLFAQLKAELEQGIPYWFSKEQERELQRHNVSFYHACPAEDVFNCCFRVALPEEECLHLSAAEIYQELKKMNSAALRGFNPNQFAQVLTKMGVGRKHTEYGNVYSVIRR